ncbi:MAG: hypothetical protein NC349_09975 [Paenibacillus sp.]|nr:hypothetical protein [Paenibacillus sp.]
MKNTETPPPSPRPEVRPQPEAPAPSTTPGSNPPVTPGNETPASQAPHTVPELSLWELMRADMPGAPVDDSSRVLANHRPSIWDLP